MSDTTSFLGGAALAGLAALIVMRGGITIGSPSTTAPSAPSFPQLSLGGNNPAVGNNPLPMPPAVVPSPAVSGRSEYEQAKQAVTVESLKAQMEQLQAQVRNQEAVLNTLTTQIRTGALTPPPAPAPASPQPMPSMTPAVDSASNSVISGLPWALGGMMLTFGGGIALVGMFVMMSRQNRSSRTIEVFHDDYPTYLPPMPSAAPPRRRVQVLPPRRVIKRVETDDD
ncbi:MAG: hypothetical protein VKJ24_04145 [Synechococcales bacterium]|nr:hypothetical protein [Synechococcales bacterium]